MRRSKERFVGLARAATLTTPTYSHQPSAEHFQQSAEFLPLRNRGLGTLAVAVLPVPLTTGGHRQQAQGLAVSVGTVAGLENR
jgi:hypothetical protein